jgi:intraflagellar transport protein 52
LLGLQPALFPPILKELAAPRLELFDLDGEFASEKIKLA